MSNQSHFEMYSLNAAENYERFFVPVIGEPLAKDLVRHAALRTGDRILDVACGTGIVTRLASQQSGETGSVTGLDIHPGMLAMARSVQPPGSSIEWQEADAGAMPLADEAFDVVLCQLGFQFMEDKVGVLQEMRRVLRPGGRIALNMPGPAGPHFTLLSEAMARHIGPEAAGFINQVFSLHDPTEIRELLSSTGFDNIEIQANTKMLHLPAPEEFLWQYIYSTPLAAKISEADEEARSGLEDEVVGKWQNLMEDGTFIYPQRIVTVSGRR